MQNAPATRLRLFAALVCAAGLLVAAAPAQAALETLVQDDASLLYRPADQVRDSMLKLRSLGVDRVRLTANWAVLVPAPDARRKPVGFDARDPAAYPQGPWQALDDAVRIAGDTGLKVMIDIGFFAPRWATTDRPGPRAHTNINPGAFADFAVAVARRYSGSWAPSSLVVSPAPPAQDHNPLDGLFGGHPAGGQTSTVVAGTPVPRVNQFVLWNEPNHPSLLLPQWTGRGRQARPASPAIYARMVRKAYAAVKAIRPESELLLGNTSSDGSGPPQGAVAPLLFIRQMACVDARLRPLHDGACKHYRRLPGDGWAHHPYPRQLRPDLSQPDHPDNVRIGDLGRMSRLLRRLAHRGRIARRLQRIHLTEFSYETQRIPGRRTVSQATQARWLTWAEYVASKVPGVVTFAQFLLRDLPPGAVRISTSKNRGFGQNYSGLQTTDGKDKIAATSFIAGLFAQQLTRSRVLLWARLRLGAGPRTITIERLVRGKPWRRLMRLTVDGRAAFSRRTRFVDGALYRLRWRRPDGTIAAGLRIGVVAARR